MVKLMEIFSLSIQNLNNGSFLLVVANRVNRLTWSQKCRKRAISPI